MLKVAAVVTALAVTSLVGCGPAIVAPPAAPSREIPRDVEPRTSPAPPGNTRLMLDANGDRALVVDVVTPKSATPLCLTPCIVDLKPGQHTLRFTSETDDRFSVTKIQIGEQNMIVRHAMGKFQPHTAPRVIGGVLLGLGLPFAAIGGGLYGSSYAIEDGEKLRSIGAPMMIGGASAVVVGAALLLLFRPEGQAGSTTEILLRSR